MNPSKHSLRWSLAALGSSMLMASLSVSITNVALPSIAASLGIRFSEAQWLTLIYLLMITVLTVTMGRLGDLWGRRSVMLAGTALYTVGALTGSFPSDLWPLIAARCLQGIGAATLMALSVASVSEFTEPKKLGSAMGLMGTVSAIGTAIGPSLGGFIIAFAGWRSIFGLMMAIGVLNIGLIYFFVPRSTQSKSSTVQSLDIKGSLLLMLALASYALAMTFGKGQLSASNAGLLIFAILTMLYFLKFESRTESPLISMSLLRDRKFRQNLSSNAIVSTVMMTTLVVGPFYISKALGFDSAHVGLLMSVGPIMSMLTGFPAGKLVDRFGAERIHIIGLSLMLVGLGGLVLFAELFGWIGYATSVAILSPGYQIFQAANSSSVMSNLNSKERGVASGLLSVSRNLGLITGTSLMGAIFNLCIGSLEEASPKAITFGMQTTFAFAAILIATALLSKLQLPDLLNFFQRHTPKRSE